MENQRMNQPQQAPWDNVVPVDMNRSGGKGGAGFAIASLVLGLLSLIGICCCSGIIDIVTIPLALIFGIISLAKKKRGTGLAITGVVTSAVSGLIIGTVLYVIWPLLPYSDQILTDYSRLTKEQDTIFENYGEDGELPDFLLKYTESPFSDFFDRYDASIYTVMDALLEQYKSQGSLPFEVFDWSSASVGTSAECISGYCLTGSD